MQDDDRAWRKLVRRQKALARTAVTVGVHGEDKERDDGEVDNVAVAAIHEFGSPDGRPPERSFLRSTFDGQAEGILDDMANVADRALQDGKVVKHARILGIKTAERVRETIRAKIDPPLSEQTLRRRRAKNSKLSKKERKRLAKVGGGNEAPLIDTGQLIQSIQSEVER